MNEYLVTMDIVFPPWLTPTERRERLAAESEASREHLDAGRMQRVWRTYGEHEGNHGHLALWKADSQVTVREAYESFPLVTGGCTKNLVVKALAVNPNDPVAREEAARWANRPINDDGSQQRPGHFLTSDGLVAVPLSDLLRP